MEKSNDNGKYVARIKLFSASSRNLVSIVVTLIVVVVFALGLFVTASWGGKILSIILLAGVYWVYKKGIYYVEFDDEGLKVTNLLYEYLVKYEDIQRFELVREGIFPIHVISIEFLDNTKKRKFRITADGDDPMSSKALEILKSKINTSRN